MPVTFVFSNWQHLLENHGTRRCSVSRHYGIEVNIGFCDITSMLPFVLFTKWNNLIKQQIEIPSDEESNQLIDNPAKVFRFVSLGF